MTILGILAGWLLKLLIVVVIIIIAFWIYGVLVRPSFVPYPLRYWPLRMVAKLLCLLGGVKIEVVGEENFPNTQGKRGYAIVANHQSNWDAIVLVATLKDPVSFITKKELAYVPVLGTWGRTLRCPFIDRKNLRQSYSGVMVQGAENIKKGIAMIIFPTGTRSQSDDVGEFKAGSFKMATSVGAPILPIALEDMYKIKNGNIFKRTKVKLHIHQWIEQSEYENLSSFELAKKTQTMIEAALVKREKKEN